jgi:UDP-N-acetylglucosamine transferase subunit ALG13
MIFVTVGHQMPFDRLVRAVDSWAGENNVKNIFAQIGITSFTPLNLKYKDRLDPMVFRKIFEQADIIISHAGTGTILTALEMNKPILIMPRLGRLKETRNDHQISTAIHFKSFNNISVAMNENELTNIIGTLNDNKGRDTKISRFASPKLLDTIRAYLNNEKTKNHK